MFSQFASVLSAWDASVHAEAAGKTVKVADLQSYAKTLLGAQQDPFGGDHSTVPWLDVSPSNARVALSHAGVAYLALRTMYQDYAGDSPGNLYNAFKLCGAKPGAETQAMAVLAMLASFCAQPPEGVVMYARSSQQVGELTQSANWLKMPDVPLCELGVCAATCAQEGCNSASGKITWTALAQQAGDSRELCAGWDSAQPQVSGAAVVDVSAQTIGGGSQLCGLSSQDESLSSFYPEVLVLAFYLKAGASVTQLPVPCYCLGVRSYMNRYVQLGVPCGAVDKSDLLSSNVIEDSATVTIGGKSVGMYRQVFVPIFGSPQGLQSSECGQSVNPNFLQAVTWVYNSLSPKLFVDEVATAFKSCVDFVASPPWGVGVFAGSAQNYFLAMWLGVSAVGADVPLWLQYYVPSQFCDGGNGLAFAACAVCAYCRPKAGTFQPGSYAKLGGGSLLDGLDSFPECSQDTCTASCTDATKAEDLLKLLKAMQGKKTSDVFSRVVESKCSQYMQWDNVFSHLS